MLLLPAQIVNTNPLLYYADGGAESRYRTGGVQLDCSNRLTDIVQGAVGW